jgi:hypothetical protein
MLDTPVVYVSTLSLTFAWSFFRIGTAMVAKRTAKKKEENKPKNLKSPL